MTDRSVIRERYTAVERGLNERSRRLLAAVEAKTAGHGGITAVSHATGVARSTIGRGLKDLAAPGSLSGVVRRPGGGGPTLIAKDPALLANLRQLVEPATMGDPMRPLMWVSKSHAKLAAALREMGHKIADSSIPKLLGLLKYRRQVNRKTLEGSHNPDRDAQFEHINAAVIATQAAGQPVISIDTKKKELVGSYKNAGSDYRPQGCADKVNVHDFVDKELGKAIPYGIYDNHRKRGLRERFSPRSAKSRTRVGRKAGSTDYPTSCCSRSSPWSPAAIRSAPSRPSSKCIVAS